jgi:hypothetical protein
MTTRKPRNVMAGLDPAIHPLQKFSKMDTRVKPAYDG